MDRGRVQGYIVDYFEVFNLENKMTFKLHIQSDFLSQWD